MSSGVRVDSTRPLDVLGSIKVKLGVLVVASIVTTIVVAHIGAGAGLSGWVTAPVTIVAGLAVTQWLARGMVSPLREMTAAASAMAAGEYGLRVTASSQDEVGRLAHAFNTMAGDLAAVDAERRQLIATVSHELRTPLTAQRALLENLVDGVVRPDDAQLQAALAQSERLSDLIADLLDLSRIDAGAAPLQVAEVDVAALLHRGVAEAEMSPRPVRHIIVVDPPDLRVRADSARLAQLVANLIENANRHSPADGEIRLAARRSGDRWILEVSDDGPGIPAGEAEAILRPFGTGATSGGGTGLGLAIGRWVAQLHGGTLIVEPTPPGQRGAQLRVDLPLEPPIGTRPPEDAVMPTDHAVEPAGQSSAGRAHDDSALAPQAPAASFLDEVFGRVWPEEDRTPRPRILLAAVAVGVLAGAVVPYRAPGIGMFALLLVAAAVIHAPSTRRHSPWFWSCVAVCVGLASLVMLRADPALGVLGLVTAGGLTASNLVSARTVSAIVAGPIAWVASGARGLPLLSRTLAATRRMSGIYPVLRTAALSLVAVVLFGGLFASADAIFGSWVSHLVPDLGWDEVITRSFIGFVVAGITLAGAYLALNPPRIADARLPVGGPVRHRYEWLVPLALVSLTFVGFHVAQASAMWGGHDYVQRTAGLTYAEYVHQGFAQLMVATVLTLLVVALVIRKADQATPADRLALRVAVTVQGVLALGVVVSAMYRMALYQEAYGYSLLRVFVDGVVGWLGLVLVLVVIAAWLPAARRWTARAALMTGSILVLSYGLMNPAAWVAQRNIDRFEAGQPLDTVYLSVLGADASPIVAQRLPRDMAQCIVAWNESPPDADALSWNLGRSRDGQARASLGLPERGEAQPSECDSLLDGSYRP